MNTNELPTSDGDVEKLASLKQERSLADRIAGAKSATINPEELELRISSLFMEKPAVTLEAFRNIWRNYIQNQLKSRSFQEIWRSVVELDNTDREDLGPDIPADEMYDRLNKAVMEIKGNSPGAVSNIIREVVLEFRPKTNSRRF